MDRDLRALERAVDGDGSDSAARRRLTIERLRRMVGLVVIWTGGEAPHDAAVAISMSKQIPALEGPGPLSFETLGWALAVVGSADLFDLIHSSRRHSIVDLETGRRMSVSPSVVPEVWPGEERPDDGGGVATPIRTGNSWVVGTEPYPLYDSEWIDKDSLDGSAVFFRNRAFRTPGHGDKHLRHSNLTSVPHGWFGDEEYNLRKSLVFTGISLELRDEHEIQLSTEAAREWASNYTLMFSFARTRLVFRSAVDFINEAPSSRMVEEPIRVNLLVSPAVLLAAPASLDSYGMFTVSLIHRYHDKSDSTVLARVTLHSYIAEEVPRPVVPDRQKC